MEGWLKARLGLDISPEKSKIVYLRKSYAVTRYNSYVLGVHNYYSMATMVSQDLRKLAFSVPKSLKSRLRERVKTAREVKKRKLSYEIPDYIKVRYGSSQQLRFVNGYALAPIGYVKHDFPRMKKRVINSLYTRGAGRNS